MEHTIKTEHLTLRPLHIRDIETVHAYASDPQNTRYMMFLPNETKEETEQFLLNVTAEWDTDTPEYYEFAITLDGKHIGAISVYPNEERTEAELGWILHKQYWGKGYTTEAALAIKDFAIHTLRIPRLVAHCDYRNLASYTVMQKIGLRLVNDTAKRQYPKTGEVATEIMCAFSVSPEDM